MKLPQTYEDRMRAMLGDEDFAAYVASLERPSSHALRVNTLKLDTAEWETLSPFTTMRRVPWIDNGYYYDDTDAPSKHPYYYAGLYYLQEPSAMTPASLLPIEPGDRVLDLCAAPGGKSTELAAKLKGTGLLVANDISATRAKALLKNLELFGAVNALVISEMSDSLAKHLPGFFDKILVDAPCSGEGMFRKQPTIIKNWEQYGTSYYNKLQREILPCAFAMLKPGGMLLYSTCTFSAEEDEETVRFVLSTMPDVELVSVIPAGREADYASYGFDHGHPEWMSEPDPQVVKCARLFPHRLDGEGHFVALFRKKDSDYSPIPLMETAFCKAKEVPSEVKDAVWEINFREGRKVDLSRLRISDGKVYSIPEGMPALQGLRVLRSGWFLGEAKKGRFEPSQAFAMGLYKDEYPNVIDLAPDDEDVLRYLKCETLEVREGMREGNALVCVAGQPLGFARIKGGQFKNRYLPGWRMM